MGMDPVGADETYEVTIVLEGPVNRIDFEAFRSKLDTFFDDTTGRSTPGNPSPNKPGLKNNHQNPPPTKPVLQVREARAGVRKKV